MRKSTVKLALLLACTAAVGPLLAGCGSSGTTTAPAPSSSVSLTASDNGHTVEVRVPGTVRVTLASEPTTGYIWRLASGGPGFVTVDPGVYHPPASRSGPGTQVFEFSLSRKGTTPLLLDYVDPRNLSVAPLKQFRATLKGV